jgi:hypothetical protein
LFLTRIYALIAVPWLPPGISGGSEHALDRCVDHSSRPQPADRPRRVRHHDQISAPRPRFPVHQGVRRGLRRRRNTMQPHRTLAQSTPAQAETQPPQRSTSSAIRSADPSSTGSPANIRSPHDPTLPPTRRSRPHSPIFEPSTTRHHRSYPLGRPRPTTPSSSSNSVHDLESTRSIRPPTTW